MIPLHVHSNYSFLQGTAAIDNLINKARDFNIQSMALTDTNGMYGLIQFYKKAVENNIKPILGAYLDDPKDSKINCIALAKNNQGFAELCKLLTLRKLNESFSLIDQLNSAFKNLFVISSCLELLKNAKRGDTFVELQSIKSQKKKNRILYEFAKASDMKLLVTNPIYFLDKNDFIIHKFLTAIKYNKSIDNLNTDELVDEESYFKNPSDIAQAWKMLPEVFENLNYISSNCNVDLKIGEYKFPSFTPPSGENSSLYLRKIAYEGLTERYHPMLQNAIDRLEYELSVIEELNFSDYFLIVWDIVKEAKRRGMMTIGRGSAANSLVSYCLGLTNVDPVKHNLYFERFLNKGRSSPPDVDIDFSWKERDEIIKYVFEKYGYENVAMISTHVTFKARSAFREVAKAFGISDREISKYSKMIPWTSAENLPKLAQVFPEAKNLNFDFEPWKTIVSIASRIAGCPRHLSIHPGGIVVAPRPITNFTALEYAKNKGLGLIITQPDMYGIEDLGLIKIDLLSQRSLGVLRDALNSIEQNKKKRSLD